MPTATLASMMADMLAALVGVSMDAVDQRAKETVSIRRPPHRCAAHPPGIYKHSTVLLQKSHGAVYMRVKGVMRL